LWLAVCLVRLLVMPRLVATTGLHRGQNAHQSRLFSTLVQHLFDPFLLAELLLTSNKFDLDSVFVSDTLHVLPNGLAQRLCPLRVVENADLVLVEVVRHALGVAPLWNRPLDDDPVVAGKNASDLALVPLGQEFDAHSGIITDILFGSGYAGLGYSLQTLCESGLVTAAGYDSYMRRIIFPLEENLYGRSLSTSAPPHRFLPGTKGGLYAWDQARQYPEVILVEGLFDYAALWQAGFHNVTCSMGTNLNARQFRQLCDGLRTVYI